MKYKTTIFVYIPPLQSNLNEYPETFLSFVYFTLCQRRAVSSDGSYALSKLCFSGRWGSCCCLLRRRCCCCCSADRHRATQQSTLQAASSLSGMAGLHDFHQGSHCHRKTWIKILLGILQILLPHVQHGGAQLQGLYSGLFSAFFGGGTITTVAGREKNWS